MRERLYLFDVDGTLTPPVAFVDEEFAEVFLRWAKGKKVYLVTGSDIQKIKKQLFSAFIDRCEGIFTCSGNVFYSKGRLVYQNELELPAGFIENLELYLEQGSEWQTKTGNHIEIRKGAVNFTTVGRNASANLREAYANWDRERGEREDIADYIKNLYPQFEVAIGGQISVDIYPVGYNKAQVVKKLLSKHGADTSMIFVGDRNVPGGNDWPLAQHLDTLDNSHWFHVNNYRETRALIEQNELFI